ncbi:siderophore-interacting protein [Streptomyces nodosus]|uniref:siderophore-interacting protein n=1 Tax=Streptomyces nodosus TaxID=40318 RepID=UPI0037F234B2
MCGPSGPTARRAPSWTSTSSCTASRTAARRGRPRPGRWPVGHLRIVADETGLPATANILASLPDGVTGDVVLEIPDDADRQELAAPAGVDVTWLARAGHEQTPGRLALAAALDLSARPGRSGPWFGFTVGERALASGVRRHWIAGGQPKDRLMFCGYWRAS